MAKNQRLNIGQNTTRQKRKERKKVNGMLFSDILVHSEVSVLSGGNQTEQVQRAVARHCVENLNYTLGGAPEIPRTGGRRIEGA